MERFFDDVGGGRPAHDGQWMPHVDAFEKDGCLVVRADLPGVNKDAVNVEVSDGELTIKGERHKEFEEEKEGVYRHEREYGSFYRSFPLPEGVKSEAVKATFNNGVLEVKVPMPPAKQEAGAHHVQIEQASAEKPAKEEVKAKPAA